ncbi:MAG: class I SAM-dependent methyltransferase [Actinomycetes bacterium]
MTYTRRFFSGQHDGSLASANVIVPIVLNEFGVGSVADIGCGTGAWLSVFQSHGVSELLGIDGGYVPRSMLMIRSDEFMAADLRTLRALDRPFDLVCSLEVAEHLPPDCAEGHIDLLVSGGPLILFSAAIPGQGGTGHVNERWQSYWALLFQERGYLPLDLVRPRVFNDPRVEPWYRQNTLVYCRKDMIAVDQRTLGEPYDLDRIDPRYLEPRGSALVAGARRLARRTVSGIVQAAGAVVRRR